MKSKQIYINFDTGDLIDESGSILLSFPTIAYKAYPTWEINFINFGQDGTKIIPDLSDAVSWVAAIDSDFNLDTPPMVRSTEIDVSKAKEGVVNVKLNSNTTSFKEKVNGKNSVQAFFEIRGLDNDGNAIYVYRFRIQALGTVDANGGISIPIDEGGITYAQAEALIGAPADVVFSVDGTNFHDDQKTSDVYFKWRINNGEWSDVVKFTSSVSGGGGSEIVIDSEISETSTNPVQNAVITLAMKKVATSLDEHIGDSSIHVTQIEKDTWNAKANLPSGGSSGQVLTTDGSGNYSWTTIDVGSDITVDSELNNTSENPVQNKVITIKINQLSEAVNSLNTSLTGVESSLVNLVTTAEGI